MSKQRLWAIRVTYSGDGEVALAYWNCNDVFGSEGCRSQDDAAFGQPLVTEKHNDAARLAKGLRTLPWIRKAVVVEVKIVPVKKAAKR